MPFPTEVAAIKAYLSEAPLEMHQRFAAILVEAQGLEDTGQVMRLVEAAEPWIDSNLYLAQWHTYALGYLAAQVENQVDKAVAYLEALRAQPVEMLTLDLPGRVFNGLGIIYEINEQWDRAQRCYQECIRFFEDRGDNLGLGKALYNLAIVYQKGQDYAEAAECIWRSIALLSQNSADPTGQAHLSNAYNELGLTLFKLGRLVEAREALERSLAIDLSLGKRVGQGISYTNLGHIQRELGEFETAAEYYRRAHQLSLAVDNHYEAAEAVYSLGVLQARSSNETDLEQAKQLFNEALSLAETSNNHEISTDVHLRRADLFARSGDVTAALTETRRAVETVESLRANIILPEDRTRMQGARIEAYEQMVFRLYQQGTPSAYAEAFYYAEMAKSRALVELLAGRPLRQPEQVPSEWLDREAQLRQALHELYTNSAANSQQTVILEAELNQLRQRIRLQDAEFESFHTVAPLSAEEIMARLPAEGVLLEYFMVDQFILAFVVTRNDIQVTQLPLTLSNLIKAFERTEEGKLGQLRYLQPSPGGRLRQPWLLNQLYQELIAPLGEIVRSAASLYIVPHGLLHYLPFHALYQQNEADPRYLSGDEANPRPIIYAPSATTLLDYCLRKTPSTQKGCLAIGYNDPVFNLSQAEWEAEQVAHLSDGSALTGTAARRETLFQQAANYRYLHFSCHGRFNPTWPIASGLSLTDGWLDVADILQHLQIEADLVSLSACETGRSQVLRGDELIGLTRAFLYAGTPSVVVSHWTVNELATRLLMKHFYQELLAASEQPEPGYKAKALGRAQNFIRKLTFDELRQIMLADYGSLEAVEPQLRSLADMAGYNSFENLQGFEPLLAHPYYWSPFFLVGD